MRGFFQRLNDRRLLELGFRSSNDMLVRLVQRPADALAAVVLDHGLAGIERETLKMDGNPLMRVHVGNSMHVVGDPRSPRRQRDVDIHRLAGLRMIGHDDGRPALDDRALEFLVAAVVIAVNMHFGRDVNLQNSVEAFVFLEDHRRQVAFVLAGVQNDQFIQTGHERFASPGHMDGGNRCPEDHQRECDVECRTHGPLRRSSARFDGTNGIIGPAPPPTRLQNG